MRRTTWCWLRREIDIAVYCFNILVQVYIKEPVVTTIWREEKTSVINFVAHTG